MTYEPPVPPPSYSAARQNRTNSLAIASMVSGIVGVFITIIVPSILAVVLGHMSLRQMRQTGEKGQGFAIAGLILGYVMLVLAFVFVFLLAPAFKATFDISNAIFNGN
jgi:ABC-type multidrug transport system fused ATPase/permease subunit